MYQIIIIFVLYTKSICHNYTKVTLLDDLWQSHWTVVQGEMTATVICIKWTLVKLLTLSQTHRLLELQRVSLWGEGWTLPGLTERGRFIKIGIQGHITGISLSFEILQLCSLIISISYKNSFALEFQLFDIIPHTRAHFVIWSLDNYILTFFSSPRRETPLCCFLLDRRESNEINFALWQILFVI